MPNFLSLIIKLPWSSGYHSWSGNPEVQGSIPTYAFLYAIYSAKINLKYVQLPVCLHQGAMA